MVNFDFMKEPKGFIKLLEILLAILAFALVAAGCNGTSWSDGSSGDFKSKGDFLIATGVMAFLYCLAFVVLMATSEDKLPGQFYLIDLIVSGVFCFFFLLASAIFAGDATYKLLSCSGFTAAIVFGFGNWICWGFQCWFSFKDYRDHKDGGAGDSSGASHYNDPVAPAAYAPPSNV